MTAYGKRRFGDRRNGFYKSAPGCCYGEVVPCSLFLANASIVKLSKRMSTGSTDTAATADLIAQSFILSGVVHAEVHEGLINVSADSEPTFAMKGYDTSWCRFFRGARFNVVKLQLNKLTDGDLLPLAAAREIRHLNLSGNDAISGHLLAACPGDIGLLSLDVSGTSIGDDDFAEILKFSTLQTVWGHTGQFDPTIVLLAKKLRPTLKFELIY